MSRVREQSPLRWLKPWIAAAGIAGAAGIVVFNFTAALFGDKVPWLAATDLVVDLAILGGCIFAVVRVAMSAEAETARMQDALSATQARLAAIVDSAMDAIITVDESQQIVLFNRAAEQVFRCRREEALGSSLDRFVPARFRAAHRGHIEQFGRTGVTSRRMGDVTTLWALRAGTGEEFPIEASISQAAEGERSFYTVILRDITLRKQYEDELTHRQVELRALSAQVLEAREEEKTRIARELHDELGQLLTALKMDLGWMQERLPGGDPDLSAKAARMGETLNQTVSSVRRIAADLRPLMLDDLGLPDATAWLVEDFAQRSGVKCDFSMAPGVELADLERNLANTVYRALQESLTNIARHAQARNAWILLAADDECIRLEIEDNGRGITSDDLARSRSLGLKGMRERVSYIGGTLEVGPAPRGGTRVALRVPLKTRRERSGA
ncbi:MAG: PAS domain-containing sensor histidine kinase [Betaproteobacteria bacterium]